MAIHFRWLPSFPKADILNPWTDGIAFLPGWCVPRFDLTMGSQARELLWGSRPWLGRFRLENLHLAGGTRYVLQTFGFFEGIEPELGLRVWFNHAFETIGTVQVENTSANVWPYVGKTLDVSALSLPYGATDEWAYVGEVGYILIPPYRYDRPPKLGRWNMTRIAGGVLWESPGTGGSPYRLQIQFEFHHMNGCWAGFDSNWVAVSSSGTYPAVPAIGTEEQSEVIVALDGEGFTFDPEALFFDYGTIP